MADPERTGGAAAAAGWSLIPGGGYACGANRCSGGDGIGVRLRASSTAGTNEDDRDGHAGACVAIGGESTGWSIQVDPEISVDGKPVHSIEIGYKDAQKLEKLNDKRVVATGKLTHKHGVETGDRPVLDVSSIKESKTK